MTEARAARLATSHVWVSTQAEVRVAASVSLVTTHLVSCNTGGQPLWVLELSIQHIIPPAGDGHAVKSP